MDKNMELVSDFLKCAENGDIEAAKSILNRGLNVNAQSIEGRSALHCAVDNRQYTFILFLFKKGALVDIKDNNQCTPLHQAVLNLDINCIELLLNNNAEIEEKDGFGMTALNNACHRGKVDLAALLLKRGANVKSKDVFGSTPLHMLAFALLDYQGELEIIDTLIDRGADVNAQDYSGSTPLHYACDKRVIKKLLEVGASNDIVNIDNRMPYDNLFDECYDEWWAKNRVSLCCAFENRVIMINHFLSLKKAGVPVTFVELDEFDTITLRNSDEELNEEFKRINLYKVCGEFSLQPFFSAFKSPDSLKLEDLNDEVERFLNSSEMAEMFPNFGFMLRNTYRTSKLKFILKPQAHKVLSKICLVTCSKNLPYLATEQVLCHLSYRDLENFIQLDENLTDYYELQQSLGNSR